MITRFVTHRRRRRDRSGHLPFSARLKRTVSAALAFCALGCSTHASPLEWFKKATNDTTPEAEQQPQPELTERYATGLWRLAPAIELSRVVLHASHILIRHQHVIPSVISFDLGDWTPAPPLPLRSREEAFAMTREILAQLSTDPSKFQSVAREVSEDIATRDSGGSLGGICASELVLMNPDILDVLSHLRPGELSRVIETRYGFHILLRREPPPEQEVSGSRIVIGYNEAPWLRSILARNDLPPRPREEALAIANSLHARLLGGESFEQLVDTYSDHQEVLRHGDFGAWSTHRCTPYPREVEILTGLAVGEVAPPLDSPFGVEVIMRTPNRPRTRYAMNVVQQRFDRLAPQGDPASRPVVLENMKRLAKDLASDPVRFAELQKTYCCAERQEWTEGEGSAGAEQALFGLRAGEVATAPVEVDNAIAIVQRLEPSTLSVEPHRLNLPTPDRPDMEYLARMALVNYELSALGQRARGALGLQGDVAEDFIDLHDEETNSNIAEFEAGREQRFREFRQKVERLLGPERYAAYLGIMDVYFKELLLKPRKGLRRVLGPEM